MNANKMVVFVFAAVVLAGGQPVHEVWISALLCPSAQGKKDYLGESIDDETYQKLGDRRDGRPIGLY